MSYLLAGYQRAPMIMEYLCGIGQSDLPHVLAPSLLFLLRQFHFKDTVHCEVQPQRTRRVRSGVGLKDP